MKRCIFLCLLSCLSITSFSVTHLSATQASELLTNSELSLIQAFGPWPQEPPPDPGNELSGLDWAELLGKRLFDETAFSTDNNRSCASCHDDQLAFTDGLSVSVGAGVHVRNAQGLLDVGHQRWFGWDGGADSLWAASLRPILSDIELNGDIPVIAARLRKMPEVLQPFEQAGFMIDTDESLLVLASKAIAAYVRTLQSARTPFDQFRDDVLAGNETASDYPADARRGLSIFLGESNCHVCHFGANFSNREFHDTGRSFFTHTGEVDSGRYSGIQRVRSDPYNLLGQYNASNNSLERTKTDSVTLTQTNFGQWRTPSLRNLNRTAPYLHNGSLQTLREVVDAYADVDPQRLHNNGEAIIKPLDLSERDRQDLVAFLRSLSPPVTSTID